MEELDIFLNERVGSDPNLLPELLDSLSKERHQIEQQLLGEVAVEGDNVWQEVVLEVKSVLNELEALKSSCNQLLYGGSGGEGEEEEEELVSLVSGKVKECSDELREKAQLLLHTQHSLSYLSCLLKIMKLCSRLELELSPGGSLVEAVGCHDDLVSMVTELETSECRHLVRYCTSSLDWWREKLREKISSDFSVVLTELQWPLSSSSISYTLSESDDRNQTFSQLFNLLLKLDPLVLRGGSHHHHHHQGNVGESMNDPLLLPLEQLMVPLRRRFQYHFTEQRSTNSLDKPEWCFTQMSSWIRSHTPFLEQLVQPLLVSSDLSHLDAVVEFTRGLLQEVVCKIKQDMQETAEDDLLMTHLIDELLLFSRELTLLGYPNSSPSPLAVLLEPTSFGKWISLERQYAAERLVAISSSSTAWSPVYESTDDVDDTRVPEVAESVLTLIAGVTDRYKSVPSHEHQLEFITLQRELLLEFLRDVVATGERETPLSPLLCSHLNACSYLAAVLKEWGEMKFFVGLHYAEQDMASSLSSQSSAPTERPDINTILLLRRQDSNFAELEGSIFSAVFVEFRTHCSVLQDRLVQQVVASFRTNCRRYRKENWQLGEAETEEVAWRELSPSLSLLLPQLRDQLVSLHRQLSPTQFATVFERIVNHSDQILFTEVILPTHFGVGGASQLNFDLTGGFLPILSQFCEELSSRQLMERSREACKLLTLLPGSAKLLQELLVGVVRGGANTPLDTYSAAVTTLNEFGVHTLEPVQVYQILTNIIITPPSTT